MSETICAGVAHRETEFALVAPGRRVFGACGPNALSEVASNSEGKVVTTSSVYWTMANAGLCDGDGVTTLANLAVAAGKLELKQVAYRGYANPPWPGWLAFFEQYAGVAPFVAQVGFGQQLVDAISGDGENANNLRSHFICVLGRNTGGWSPKANRNLPAGFWVADGCNFAGGNNNGNDFNAADVLQFYPDSVFGAALPCGALVIEGATKMAWTKQADGSGKDDKGNVCGSGTYEALVAANLAQFDGRMSETHYTASGVADVAFLPLVNGAVVHAVQQTAGGTWAQDLNAAQVAIDLYELAQADAAALVTAKNELTNAEAENTKLQAQVAQLQQEIQQLQQQPPSGDPTAVALVAAIKAALAAAA